jgi:hypothetical protein
MNPENQQACIHTPPPNDDPVENLSDFLNNFREMAREEQ